MQSATIEGHPLRSKPATVPPQPQRRGPMNSFFSILLSLILKSRPNCRMNHLRSPALRSLKRSFSRDGHWDLTSSDAMKIQSYSKRCTVWPFSPATGGSQMVGASNLEMITRPSNEILNHWLYSAACSRSSPTAQPGSHYDNRQCLTSSSFVDHSPLCAHGKTMGHEVPE